VGAVEEVDSIGAEVRELALVESDPFGVRHHDISHHPLVVDTLQVSGFDSLALSTTTIQSTMRV
jgi:hypothetical protein